MRARKASVNKKPLLRVYKKRRANFLLRAMSSIIGYRLHMCFSNGRSTSSMQESYLRWSCPRSLILLVYILAYLVAETHLFASPSTNKTRGAFSISSPDFEYGMRMPSHCAKDNENKPPTLLIKDIPPGTRSLAIEMVDPDNPSGVWIHWIAANIPASVRVLSADALPDETVIGINDFGNSQYDGPSPPAGTHHYLIHIFALNAILDLKPGFNYRRLENLMWGHIIERSTLMGTYSKNL
ncbi:MAG: YbhB/YbcL family Raf kinase inhibitor-like protein [Verrucomicrobia bacterium]|nr:MAG: YbhB/YbcL family Raf kinase inhibitor-like protein [Verrucomicrobiota bacterium]